MTSRLVTFILFPCLIIALFLALAGVEQIEFGDTYYNFLKDVSRVYNSWSFSIPKIPTIPDFIGIDFDDSPLIIVVLVRIAKAFFGFINLLVSFLNVVILIFNVLIKIIQFCLSLIYCLIGFRDSVAGVVSLS